VPYSIEKNLGKAYNEAMSRIPEDDWACIIDYDVQLLTPDAGKILHDYAKLYKQAGLLTCFTNRIHHLGFTQLLGSVVSENTNITHHINLAEKQKIFLYNVTTIKKPISGFLMMLSKKTWNDFKFSEEHKCLGVDNYYSRDLINAGRRILRMDGLYVFHQYRIKNGVTDKSHLL
jgi:hypothetical protein